MPRRPPIESSTPGDGEYRTVNAALTGLDRLRDSLALRVKGELEAAAFGDQPVIGAAGQTAACKGIIAAAGVLAKRLSSNGPTAPPPRRLCQGGGASMRPVSDNGPVESQPREVVILGSTGSIGTQALDIVRRNPDRFRVVALAAGGGQPDLLARQAAEFGVAAVAVASAGRRGRGPGPISRTGRVSPHPRPRCSPGRTRSASWPRGRATWCSTG